jgi:S1-C subfamily serine protease
VVVIDGQAVVGFNRPKIDQLLVQMGARKPKLGAAIADARRIASSRGLELPAGAFVGRVEPGSSGARAGLAVGDVIVGLAGVEVVSDQDIDRIMSQLQNGQSAPMQIWRDGRMMEMVVSF